MTALDAVHRVALLLVEQEAEVKRLAESRAGWRNCAKHTEKRVAELEDSMKTLMALLAGDDKKLMQEFRDAQAELKAAREDHMEYVAAVDYQLLQKNKKLDKARERIKWLRKILYLQQQQTRR